jgi:putative Ca2+/H+ antiporter (TMEM165/GDT1 family)
VDSYLFFLAFGTVFFTEILGDKALFTISALVARFPSLPVFGGIVLAFMAKMLAAVLIGNAIAGFPATLVAGASATTFLATAIVIWFKKQEENSSSERLPVICWRKAVLTAFAAIFFSEWADAGQISAAMLAARHQAPVAIWFAATLALVAKGVLALSLGIGLRRYLPRRVLRCGAFALCLTMSVLSALRV